MKTTGSRFPIRWTLFVQYNSHVKCFRALASSYYWSRCSSISFFSNNLIKILVLLSEINFRKRAMKTKNKKRINRKHIRNQSVIIFYYSSILFIDFLLFKLPLVLTAIYLYFNNMSITMRYFCTSRCSPISLFSSISINFEINQNLKLAFKREISKKDK